MSFLTTDELYDIFESKNYSLCYKAKDPHSKKLIEIARYESHHNPITKDHETVDIILKPTRPENMTLQDDLSNIKKLARHVKPYIDIAQRKKKEIPKKQQLFNSITNNPQGWNVYCQGCMSAIKNNNMTEDEINRESIFTLQEIKSALREYENLDPKKKEKIKQNMALDFSKMYKQH